MSNKNFECEDEKVEIVSLKNGKGVVASHYIAEGEVFLTERSELFHELTADDYNDPACDACFLVREILREPAYRLLYGKFGFDSFSVHAKKPTKDDKKFLKKLAKNSEFSYDRILHMFKNVCAYNVRAFYKSPSSQRVRIQLSKIVNKVNHSCNPNTSVLNTFSTESDFNSNLISLKAIRPIQIGEEITFSYVAPELISTLDVSPRRAEIKSLFGFICYCEKCLEESSQLFHSV